MDFLIEPLEPGKDLDPFQEGNPEFIACTSGYVCVAGEEQIDLAEYD